MPKTALNTACLRMMYCGVSHCGTEETDPTGNREVAGSIPGLA